MINLYQTKTKSKITGLNTPQEIPKPKPNSYYTEVFELLSKDVLIDSTKQINDYSDPELELSDKTTTESNPKASTQTKLANNYDFKLFSSKDFIQNLIGIIGVTLFVRYLSSIIFSFILSNGNWSWTLYNGFFPVVGFSNLSLETFANINAYSILVTAIIPSFVLLYWTIKRNSLTNPENLLIITHNNINKYPSSSSEYKFSLKSINQFLPKLFREELIPWYIGGFMGVLQYSVMYFFMKDRQGFVLLKDVIFFLVLLLALNNLLMIILNKSQKTVMVKLKNLL